jgi:hypothetical protein
MILLILLFGPCKINALSRFISQQVHWIQFQLLVKEYSPLPMHKSSIQFYLGPQETTQVNPWDKSHHPYPLSPHCQHNSARWVFAPLPNSNWVLVSEGRLVGSGNLRDRWVSIPSSMESTMSPAFWGGDAWPHKSATGLIDRMPSRLFPPDKWQTDQFIKESPCVQIHGQWKAPP